MAKGEKNKNKKKKKKDGRKNGKKGNKNRSDNKKNKRNRMKEKNGENPNESKISRYEETELGDSKTEVIQDFGPFGNFFKSLVTRNTYL